MFITVRRHEREKQELISANTRLNDAILRNSDQGLFLIDAKGKLLPPVSRALSVLFRRDDFVNLSVDKLLAPIVSAKTLTLVRTHMSHLINGTWNDGQPVNVLRDIEVRLASSDGSPQTAHYWFDFDPVETPDQPKVWLVRVTDITMQVQTLRELEDLRAQVQTQSEVLRGVLLEGRARFAAFIRKTDASMKTIGTVLKKSAREQEAFRGKLEETLAEVDLIRRQAAGFKLTALLQAAQVFEDALHELRSRGTLSGGDFLPLAVKLDDLYNQFAVIRSLTPAAASGGTQSAEAVRTTPPAAGSLDNALQALTTHVAERHKKQVVLESTGVTLVPLRYQAAVKNVAIQLIRNAVMHGIESPAEREAAGKALHGTMRLEFKVRSDCYELAFEDDGRGLDPDHVRATAVQRGLITGEVASRMRDREAIKLIFKSRFTTLADSDSEAAHGNGMSLVRRYVHEAGGKIALASLPGHETRFKITLPALAATADPAESAASDATQVA